MMMIMMKMMMMMMMVMMMMMMMMMTDLYIGEHAHELLLRDLLRSKRRPKLPPLRQIP
jgi:hypothetical protein